MLGLIQVNIAGSADLPIGLDERMAEIAALIQAHQVDIVTVQAGTDPGGNTEPLDRLIAHLPDHPPAVRSGGMAILSRVAMAEPQIVSLSTAPQAEDPSDRQFLTSALPDHEGLTIGCAYYSWIERQAASNISESMAALPSTGDILLVGDFNQQPDAAPIQTLLGAGFVDAWARLSPCDPGLTFEVGKLWARLDLMFERASRPIVRSVARLAAEGKPRLSNHALLTARIDR